MATIKKKAYAGKNQSEQQIVTLANTISTFMAANKKIFTGLVSVLAAIIVIGGGYSLKRSVDEQNAGPLFAAAYEVYSQTGSGQDYAKSLELFRSVQNRYPSSMSGALSRFYAANCLMSLAKYEEALKEYQAFTREYAKDSLLAGLAYGRMGYLYASMGKQADAVKAFEQQESLMGPGVATIELARLYEVTGKEQESQKKYKLITEKLAGTAWAMEAMGKVQKIGAVPASVPGSK